MKSEIATFVDAFPNSVIWGNPNNGQGYDLVLLGQIEAVRIDVDDLQTRLDSPTYAKAIESLRTIGMLRGRPALDLRGHRSRPEAVAVQCCHQPRP